MSRWSESAQPRRNQFDGGGTRISKLAQWTKSQPILALFIFLNASRKRSVFTFSKWTLISANDNVCGTLFL